MLKLMMKCASIIAMGDAAYVVSVRENERNR